MEMKAYILYEANGPLVYETVNLAEPGQDEVLVKLTATGICHTDLSLQAVGPVLPLLLGHEGAGIVEKVGPGVDNVKEGDRVVLCWDYCRTCKPCRLGNVHDCEHFDEINGYRTKTPDGRSKLTNQKGEEIYCFFQGTFATHSVVSKNSVIVVDQDVPLEMLAPLACGVQTGVGTVLNYLKPNYNNTLVITGVGTVGLSAILGAKLGNCGNIVAIDVNEKKLAMAEEFGATHIINSKGIKNLASEVIKATGCKANYVIDTTGVPDLITEALNILDNSGIMVALAMGPPLTVSPVPQLIYGGKLLTSIAEGAADPHKIIPMMIERYKEGRFPIDRIMDYYGFDEFDKACEDFHKGIAIKPVLKI